VKVSEETFPSDNAVRQPAVICAESYDLARLWHSRHNGMKRVLGEYVDHYNLVGAEARIDVDQCCPAALR
jgi:hypothetical protein